MFLPIVFCVLIYGILYIVAKPMIDPLANFFAINYGNKAVEETSNLYTGLPEKLKTAKSVNLDELGGMPKLGDKYGTLKISETIVNCDLYYGDTEQELYNGAGTYAGGKIPGDGGTIMLAGHTGTFFGDFKSAKLGAKVSIDTYYGSYEYEITDMKVVNHKDSSAYDLEATTENLILYTCYPFNQIAATPLRYFIYCKPISGPTIVHS
ncbi:MAG: class D sortase [Oscillospiraceae bacterium]